MSNPYEAPTERSGAGDSDAAPLFDGNAEGNAEGSAEGNAALRAIAFFSFGSLLLHLTAIPIVCGLGVVFWLGADEWMSVLIKTLAFTGVVSLGVLCISTQFYLASKRKSRRE